MMRPCVSECNLTNGHVTPVQAIDELYCEILFEILHNVGCDISYEVGQTALFSYAQDAFKIPNDKHR
nr:unnamed protein product [Callosobruchus chinensis]